MIRVARRVWPLTLRGSGALALAVTAFVVAQITGLVELVYVAALLAALLVSGMVSLWVTRRVDAVSRTLSPEVAAVGRESVVTVRVRVRNPLPASPGIWDDAVPAGLDARARGVFPAVGSALRGGERTVELRYTVEGRVRGIHPIGPFGLTVTDPFGLARRRSKVGGTTPVTVAPRIADLAVFRGASGDSGGMLDASITQLGQGADDLIARPYAPGDSMRRIHWRASAHRDTLMVRQEEQETSPEATVILDRGAAQWGPDAARGAGADDAFETAVAIAVSVIARLVRDGFTVEVLDSDGTALAEPVPGGDLHEVDALATQFATLAARPGAGIARTADIFAGVQTGPVVVVTGRLRVEDALALAPLSHHCATAVVMTAAPSSDALARLRERGWHTGTAHAESELAEAWESAMDRGASRVGG